MEAPVSSPQSGWGLCLSCYIVFLGGSRADRMLSACSSKALRSVIIRDGEINDHAMRQNLISHHDLEEDLRLDAETEDISKIKIARLETQR